MHFIIDKNHLFLAIQHVSKAVSSKTTIPILTGIKLEVDKHGVTLTGSDSDITIQMFIPVTENDKEIIQIFEEGKIVLPKYIIDIVKKLPSNEIEFKINDQLIVYIKSGSSEFRLNVFDAEEYPVIPQVNQEYVLNIQSELLKTIIKQTLFAVSTVESRPILTGVLWQLENNSLKFIATDSHRLAIREVKVETDTDLTFNNIVVPGKSLNELNKILPDEQMIVQIIFTENQLLIKLGHILFLSRLLDGTYPDISRIIPNKETTKIILETKKIFEAIERASLISKDVKNNVVKLIIKDDSLLEINSISSEMGKVTEQVEIKELEGELIKISFNSKYTLDALRTIDSEEIIIEFTGALSPFIIKPADHEKMLHLILPIRT